MGPSYANLFVGFIEHQFFSQYQGPKPKLYGRYIDDCIGATSSTSQDYKRLRRKTLTAFHLPSYFTITTKLSVLKTLNYSKTIQRLVLSFRNLH